MELKYGNTSFVLNLLPDKISNIIQSPDLLPDIVDPDIIIASAIEGCSERNRSFSPGTVW
jgi:hypothetical protein